MKDSDLDDAEDVSESAIRVTERTAARDTERRGDAHLTEQPTDPVPDRIGRRGWIALAGPSSRPDSGRRTSPATRSRACEGGSLIVTVAGGGAGTEVVGAHVVGANAGEVVQQFAFMMAWRLPAGMLAKTVQRHPTYAGTP